MVEYAENKSKVTQNWLSQIYEMCILSFNRQFIVKRNMYFKNRHRKYFFRQLMESLGFNMLQWICLAVKDFST